MKRPNPAKKIALCAVLSALSVAILAIGRLVSVLDLSLALLAGAVVMVAEIEFSEGHGWSVFAVTSALSLLLWLEEPAFLYVFFFGWYPLARKHLARLPKWLRILLKVAFFNLLTAAYLFASVFLLGSPQEPWWMIVLSFVLANLMFSLYEPALDRIALFYVTRVRSRFHR